MYFFYIGCVAAKLLFYLMILFSLKIVINFLNYLAIQLKMLIITILYKVGLCYDIDN